MSDPDGNALFVQILREFQNVLVALLGQLLVLGVVDVLDVQHDQICHCHKAIEFLAAFLPEQDSGGVQTGMDALFLGSFKQFCQELHLHQRLAAGGGNAAVMEKFLDAVILFQQGFHRTQIFGVAVVDRPRVRIVAVLTPHGAALKENHKANAGAVNGAEAFGRMNVSFHVVLLS